MIEKKMNTIEKYSGERKPSSGKKNAKTGETILGSIAKTPYINMPVRRTFGYVVSILDALNVDIDIWLPPEIDTMYRGAIRANYIFKEIVNGSCIEQPKQSRAIRCHLKNIALPKPDSQDNIDTVGAAKIFTITWLMEHDRWVGLEISDVDIYKRVLVRIFDLNFQRSLDEELRGRFGLPEYRSS